MGSYEKQRFVAGQPDRTGALAVLCQPDTDYAAAAAALFNTGKKELHLVFFSEGQFLPQGAVHAARGLSRRAVGLHVTAILEKPPHPDVFTAMQGLDFSAYAYIRSGEELPDSFFQTLARSARAAARFSFRLKAMLVVPPTAAGNLHLLLAALTRHGVGYALLVPDPGGGLLKAEETFFLRTLARQVAGAHGVREGDHPPAMQIENTLPVDEAGLRPSDPLLVSGKIYPICHRLSSSLLAGWDKGFGRNKLIPIEKEFLRFTSRFSELMRGQAMQWTEPSENAWITRSLLDGDIRGQGRFIRRNLPGVNSVFLFVASGCLHNCVFCQNKLLTQKNDISALHRFVDSNRFAGYRKISIIGNEPLLEPAILKLIARARQRGFTRVELMTSGTMLSSKALCRRLAAAGLTEAAIPVMGCCAKSHDALTAVQGSFNEALAGIKAATAAGIKVYTHANALKQNLCELPETEALARRLKTTFCIFSLRPKGPGAMRTSYSELVPSYSEMIRVLAGRVNSLIGFPVCVQRRIQADCQVTSDELADSLKLYMLHQNYTKPKKCGNCHAAARCVGTYRQYLDIHGAAELVPLCRKK